jgi:multidrug efflux pump subunit AcrA (membrane-fusion protein)
MMDEEKKKKLIIKLSIVFFLLLAGLTLLSKTIDTLLLPVVTIVGVESGKLNKNIQTVGYLELLDTKIIKAESDWFFDDVYARAGGSVKNGTVLAVINEDKYQASIKKKTLEKIRIENDFKIKKEEYENNRKELQDEKRIIENSLHILEITESKESELDNKRLELQKVVNKIEVTDEQMVLIKLEYQSEIDIVEHELNELKDHFPNAGQIVSDTDGTINTVYIDAKTEVSPGARLFEVRSDDSRYGVTCYLNFSQVSLVEIGSAVWIETKYPKEALFEGVVQNIEYENDKKQYRLQLEIKDQDVLKKEKNIEGLEVAVTIIVESQIHDIIIPNRVIRSNLESGDYVFVLRDEENQFSNIFHVRKILVSIIDSDDYDSSVESIYLAGTYNRVVDTTSKPIEDNAKVRLE